MQKGEKRLPGIFVHSLCLALWKDSNHKNNEVAAAADHTWDTAFFLQVNQALGFYQPKVAGILT